MVRDRALEKRAHINFFFRISRDDYYIVKLPFYENVLINESRRANYNRQSPLGRSSNLFAYTGSDSKKLNLRFNITLPHLYENISSLVYNQYRDGLGFVRNTERERFRNNPSAAEPDPELRAVKQIERLYRLFRHVVPESDTRFGPGLQFVQDVLDEVNIFGSLLDSEPEDPITKKKIQAIYLLWVNLIRSSVITNHRSPHLGPPILYFNYGAMYNETPFICTNYSINQDDRFGYELKSLMPRRVQITLTLEEMRAGNYGEFKPKDYKRGDNDYGWDDVLYWGTSDSGKTADSLIFETEDLRGFDNPAARIFNG